MESGNHGSSPHRSGLYRVGRHGRIRRRTERSIRDSRDRDLGRPVRSDVWRLDGCSSIDAEDLAKIGGHDMFGHIQAQDAPEHTEAEQPEVEAQCTPRRPASPPGSFERKVVPWKPLWTERRATGRGAAWKREQSGIYPILASGSTEGWRASKHEDRRSRIVLTRSDRDGFRGRRSRHRTGLAHAIKPDYGQVGSIAGRQDELLLDTIEERSERLDVEPFHRQFSGTDHLREQRKESSSLGPRVEDGPVGIGSCRFLNRLTPSRGAGELHCLIGLCLVDATVAQTLGGLGRREIGGHLKGRSRVGQTDTQDGHPEGKPVGGRLNLGFHLVGDSTPV